MCKVVVNGSTVDGCEFVVFIQIFGNVCWHFENDDDYFLICVVVLLLAIV